MMIIKQVEKLSNEDFIAGGFLVSKIENFGDRSNLKRGILFDIHLGTTG